MKKIKKWKMDAMKKEWNWKIMRDFKEKPWEERKNDGMQNMAEWIKKTIKNNKQTNKTTKYEETEKTVLVRLIDSLETENTG